MLKCHCVLSVPAPLPNELFRSWFLPPAERAFAILGAKTALRGYHVQLHLYARCDKTYPKLSQMLINDHVQPNVKVGKANPKLRQVRRQR